MGASKRIFEEERQRVSNHYKNKNKMSRSNNTDIKNPSVKYFEWNGDKGGFKYYDKEKKDEPSKGQIQVPYPFRFLVLDQLTTIKGFSDADQSGFWSNEIRDIKKELLTVRTKNGIEFTGLYDQVKEKLGAKGADYSKSVYIGFFEGKSMVIGNVQMKGASIGPWIDFCKDNDVMKCGVVVKYHTEAKKGKTVYQVPVFQKLDITEESNTTAVELDKVLQEYFKSYFSRNNTESASTETRSDEPRKLEGAEKAAKVAELKEELNTKKHDPSVSLSPDPEDDLPF